MSSASLITTSSSSSHHHQFQLEGTTPGRGSFVSSLPSIDNNSVSSISNNNYSAVSAGSTDEEDAKKQMIMNLYQQMMVKHVLVLTSFLDKANEEDRESTIGGLPVKDCSHHDVSTQRGICLRFNLLLPNTIMKMKTIHVTLMKRIPTNPSHVSFTRLYLTRIQITPYIGYPVVRALSFPIGMSSPQTFCLENLMMSIWRPS